MKIIILTTLLTFISGPAVAQGSDQSARTLVHLLSYLAKDYGGAVNQGKVISESEYAEQVEFSLTARKEATIVAAETSDPELVASVESLAALIASKGEADAVSSLARTIQGRVIASTNLVVAPSQWPHRDGARELYQANCALCHGDTGSGDGLSGQGLDPKPTNFLDPGAMAELSPFGAFNTIQLGVPGTGMPAFASLTDDEIWNLAFLVVGMRYDGKGPPTTDATFDQATLRRVATLSDVALEADESTLAAWRLHSESFDAQASSMFTNIARNHLDNALKHYRENQPDEARAFALKAYLDGVEPIEPRLKANDADAVAKLEVAMGAVRASIEAREAEPSLAAKVQAARVELDAADLLLTHKEMTASATFITAAAIILREGFEAVLLVLALLGVIRASGSKRAAAWVHGGWIAALAVGGVAWMLSGLLLKISGASREMMEALTALFAVVVLLYVGFWLHRQTEIGRWRTFLDGKIKTMLEGKNLFGLAMISFLAVFRECFETVLFLRAIWVESGDSGKTGMAFGVLSSLVFVIGLAWMLLASSRRLPIRQLFNVSAMIMGVLATLLAGKGFHSLQEAGYLSITSTPLPWRWDLIGLFPTWETTLLQALVLLTVAFIWVVGNRPSKPALARVRA